MDTMNGDATLANERSERAKKLDEHITARLDVINMALDYEHPEIAEFYEAVKADIKVYLVSDEEDDF